MRIHIAVILVLQALFVFADSAAVPIVLDNPEEAPLHALIDTDGLADIVGDKLEDDIAEQVEEIIDEEVQPELDDLANAVKKKRQGCQSGSKELGYEKKKKGKKTWHTITFNPPFEHTPAIVWGITHIDSNRKQNVRLQTKITNLTKNGFKLLIGAFSDTHLYQARVSWMACPKQI